MGKEMTMKSGKAEVCYGDERCLEKFTSLLSELGLPSILLRSLQDNMAECGYVKETGFFWVKNKKKSHSIRFENVVISFDSEVTAYFQPNKIRNLTGVRAREYLIWISLTEICVDDSAVITFRTKPGFSKSFPLSLFDVSADGDASPATTEQEIVQLQRC